MDGSTLVVGTILRDGGRRWIDVPTSHRVGSCTNTPGQDDLLMLDLDVDDFDLKSLCGLLIDILEIVDSTNGTEACQHVADRAAVQHLPGNCGAGQVSLPGAIMHDLR